MIFRFFFFFKQKTAYEMRISDWSSDVCSSDLDGSVIVPIGTLLDEALVAQIEAIGTQSVKIRSPLICESKMGVCGKCYGRDLARDTPVNIGEEIGRASCRERVCQYV